MSEKDFVDLLNDEMKELIENLPQVKQLKQELEELKEDNKRLNELLVGGTEVIDYWNNKYLEERAKNTELQKQVDKLKDIIGKRVVREKIPTRCDSCPFCLQRDNKDGTATIDWVCLANDTTRMPMATLHYTDTMHWRHDKCPLISVEIIQQQAVKDMAPLAIQRFINQLYIDHIITDNDLENEMLKVRSFVLKRYYGVEVE